MSALDIDAIEARANAATDGPWRPEQGASGGWWVECPNTATIANIDCDYSDNPAGDAEFIAASRTDVLALVARVRFLEIFLGDLYPGYPNLHGDAA